MNGDNFLFETILDLPEDEYKSQIKFADSTNCECDCYDCNYNCEECDNG